MAHYETDIAIIGAGPSGLFSVFEAGFLGYKCVVIDSLPEIGGQLSALYPEKPIYDIPGYPEILAGDLVKKLEEQAAPFEPAYLLNSPVQQMSGTAGNFTLTLPEDTVHAKVIVIAGGSGVFTPRKPPLENLAAFEDSSVFYAVKGKDKFAGKTVTIAGGGDSACDWAVELAKTAAHIHVVHRRNDFRAADETVRQMKDLVQAGKITLHTPCQLQELYGTAGQLEKIDIKDFDDNIHQISSDYLLCFFGLSPSLGPIAEWGLGIEKKKVSVAPTSMKTTVDGILAIGDIAEYEGKISLILVGFAEAAIAAKTAQSIIDPDKKFKLVYSTSKGVPGAA